MDLSQNRLPPVPRTARGEGVRGHAPFLEASRNASKGGWSENGVERRAEPRAIKGGPHARQGRSPGGPCSCCFPFSLGSCSRLRWSPFLAWFMRSWSCERPVCWRRGQKALLCRLCGVDQRVRTRSAGESSPATREARKPGASTLAVVGAGRHDPTTTKGGAGNLHGLVGPFGQPRPTS